MMKTLTVAVLAFFCVPALAQDVLDEVANQIVLEEQPKTAEEALERLHEKIEAVNRYTVAALEQIARQAAAEGDIGKASEAWEEVLKIQRQHEEATKFFELIGRQDVIDGSKLQRELIGTTWKWYNGAEVSFMARGQRIVRRLDGTTERGGPWSVDSRGGVIMLKTNKTGVIDKLYLVRGGQMLEWKDSRGDRGWAVRIDKQRR